RDPFHGLPSCPFSKGRILLPSTSVSGFTCTPPAAVTWRTPPSRPRVVAQLCEGAQTPAFHTPNYPIKKSAAFSPGRIGDPAPFYLAILFPSQIQFPIPRNVLIWTTL